MRRNRNFRILAVSFQKSYDYSLAVFGYFNRFDDNVSVDLNNTVAFSALTYYQGIVVTISSLYDVAILPAAFVRIEGVCESMTTHIALGVGIFRTTQEIERDYSLFYSVSVLTIVDYCNAVAVLIHVDKFVRTYLELCFSDGRIVESASVNVAELNVAVYGISVYRRRKIRSEHFITFSPLRFRLEVDEFIALSKYYFLLDKALSVFIQTLSYRLYTVYV